MKNVLVVVLSFLQSFAVFASAPATSAGDHEQTGKAHRDNNALFPPQMADKSRATMPEQAKLISPKFMSKVTADKQKLEWSASPTADAYHVQVATDPNFKWLVADDHWVKATSFEVSGLQKGKHYYWRVASVKSDNDAMAMKNNFVSSMFSAE